MSTAFDPITWARSHAPVVYRADGKPDANAHHVLLALSTFSDKSGRARPSLATLADASLRTVETVSDALGRLAAACVIESVGSFGGTGATVWRLAMERTRDQRVADELTERRERARLKAAERVRRHRLKRASVTVPETVTDDHGNGVEGRYVTVSDTVTDDCGNGAGDRYVTVPETVTSELVTVPHTVSNGAGDRYVTVRTPLHPQVTGSELPIELPMNCHKEHSPPTAGKRARARIAYTADFEAFWIAYGRKGAKPAAFTEWRSALERAGPEVIMAAVAPYVAATAGADMRYRKDAERWLKSDGWESAVVARTPATNGHRPYLNPTDQSAYDDPI